MAEPDTDGKTPTDLRTEGGTPIHLTPEPCTGCGCFLAFAFECNCGAVHRDVCHNCGGFVGMQHEPIEKEDDGVSFVWSVRCTSGRVPHEHEHPAVPRSRDN